MLGVLFESRVMEAWRVTAPFVSLLVVAIFIDVAGGITVAFLARIANSTAARIGIARKILEILVVAACSLLDGILPRITLPLIGEATWGAAVAASILIWEVISVIEKASLLGLPLGRVSMALSKVRQAVEGGLLDGKNSSKKEDSSTNG